MIAVQLGIIGVIFWIVSFVFYMKANNNAFALGMFFSSWIANLSFCYYFIGRIICGDWNVWWICVLGVAFVALAVFRAYSFLKLLFQ